jgi:hypothetical protein
LDVIRRRSRIYYIIKALIKVQVEATPLRWLSRLEILILIKEKKEKYIPSILHKEFWRG